MRKSKKTMIKKAAKRSKTTMNKTSNGHNYSVIIKKVAAEATEAVGNLAKFDAFFEKFFAAKRLKKSDVIKASKLISEASPFHYFGPNLYGKGDKVYWMLDVGARKPTGVVKKFLDLYMDHVKKHGQWDVLVEMNSEMHMQEEVETADWEGSEEDAA